MVDKSPEELKRKLGNDRTRWFATDKGTAHINMFDDYVQLWDEDSKYMGDYDWFYLAAAIQGMWNVVSFEVTEEKRKRELKEQREESEIEIAPAQTETIPEVTADAKDIKAEELSLENLSIQINTDVWPEDISERTIWYWPVSGGNCKTYGQIPIPREETEIPERPGIYNAVSGSGLYQEL